VAEETVGRRPGYPAVTCDAIWFEQKAVLLVKRKYEPFKGKWALPGGHVEIGETCEQCVLRELKEETGLDAELGLLVGVYSGPGRDPRPGGRISVAFLVHGDWGEPNGGDDAADAQWVPTDELTADRLGFDHWQIIRDAWKLWEDTKARTFRSRPTPPVILRAHDFHDV
jgi:8-oxo-dGTP diphosphatase